MLIRIAVAAALFGSVAHVQAGDWPCFRGPTRDGISTETGLPVEWNGTKGNEKNIKWQITLDNKGNGSPIVIGERIYLLGAKDGGKKRGTYCYDRKTGKELWSQIIEFTGEEPTHGTNPYCGSTPASDGKCVVVWHGTPGVYCYDLDGKELWHRELGPVKQIWGYGSSPVIHDGRVFLNFGPGKLSFVAALNLADGKTLWQVDETDGSDGAKAEDGKSQPWIGSWATPIVKKIDGRDQVIVDMPHRVQAYDPATGAMLWKIEGLGNLAYTDTHLGDGYGVAMSGFHGPAFGFKLGGSGDVTESHRLWLHKSKNPQRIGSGVIVGDHLFMVTEQGIAVCLDVKSGEQKWEERMPGGGSFWASTILADGKLYATSKGRQMTVFAPNPEKFEVLAENEVADGSYATPAFSNGEIIHRTFSGLMCISTKP